VSVRSRRLGAAVPTPAGAGLLVVPADRTAILKELVLSNHGALPGTFIGVWVSRFAGDILLIASGTPSSGEVLRFERWLVIHEGESLYCTSSVINTDQRVYASGTLLLGDPA
jgi:hypothetical protein